jgi:hypothetical protein
MNLHSLFTDVKISLEIIEIAADNTTYNGTGVDMARYKHVAFIGAVRHGEIKVNSMKVQQDSAANFASAADLAGTSVDLSTTASLVEVKNVQKRYVRPALIVADWTTPTAACVIGIRWGNKQLPETNTGSELHNAPAQGTA